MNHNPTTNQKEQQPTMLSQVKRKEKKMDGKKAMRKERKNQKKMLKTSTYF